MVALGRYAARHAWGIVATFLALMALGGTAYAVTSLPARSVGTAQLRDGAVTTRTIRASTQHALQGQTGPRGHTGPPGPAGPSELFAADRSEGPDSVPAASDVTTPYTAVDELQQVPAGTWLISGTSIVFGTAGEELACSLSSDGGTATSIGSYDSFFPDSTHDPGAGILTPEATATVTLVKSSEVTLSCRGFDTQGSGATWTATDSHVTAEEVQSVVVSDGTPDRASGSGRHRS